tara:strand:- start:58 stop:954 length:897 start_codon:yes stop_codon:yes gene_type:complete
MPLPLAAALPAISAFIARRGITEAIKKYASTYGRKAVMAAGKTKDLSSKGELGPAGHLSASKPPKVRGTKTQAGTEMPPTSIDKTAAEAVRRAANEAAQVKRGAGRIKKVGAGLIGAETGYAVGEAGRGAYDKSKNAAEVERLRRVGQRGAFRQAGERTAKAKAAAKADTNAKLNAALRTRTDADAVMTPLSSKVVAKPKGLKTNPTDARTIAASRKAKPAGTTFTGRDERQKANVTKKELAASGMSLRDYLNKQQGKTRRTEMKKGGAVKKTTKAKKTNKVRGSGIAVRGVRPAKMR